MAEQETGRDRIALQRYWDDPAVESMYDKYLLESEIALIVPSIPSGSHILDAGCGEAEGTLVYSSIPDVAIDAVDFSPTRLDKARERLADRPNVHLHRVDFLEPFPLPARYSVVVSQRFPINFLDRDLQYRVLESLVTLLSPGGRIILLEGSRQGVDALNEFRQLLGLAPIPVRWHNLFFDDEQLASFMATLGCRLTRTDGLGVYYLLTRGIRPAIDRELNWECTFNRAAAAPQVRQALGIDGRRHSRLKLWVFDRS